MNGLPSGFLVLAVSNILVDCTVDVNVNLIDGPLFNDGYFTSLVLEINQTISYV